MAKAVASTSKSVSSENGESRFPDGFPAVTYLAEVDAAAFSMTEATTSGSGWLSLS